MQNNPLMQIYQHYLSSHLDLDNKLSFYDFIMFNTLVTSFASLDHTKVWNKEFFLFFLSMCFSDCRDNLQRELTTQEYFDIYEAIKDEFDYHKT
jgi:hypothetical protein